MKQGYTPQRLHLRAWSCRCPGGRAAECHAAALRPGGSISQGGSVGTQSAPARPVVNTLAWQVTYRGTPCTL